MAEKPEKRRFSLESLVLGIISIVSGLVLFFLMPSKPFGLNLIDVINPEEQFLRYAFILFLLLLFGSVAFGTAIVSIVAGTKDYRGINRGLYIDKGKRIYVAGLTLGIAGLCLLLTILIIWTVF
jgi:hypothetical protein